MKRYAKFFLLLHLVSACKPGQTFSAKIQNSENSVPKGSELVPDQKKPVIIPPPDPDEEVKVVDPAIIGGAFLFCDSNESITSDKKVMQVGCRAGKVLDSDWASADKQVQIMNVVDGSVMNLIPVMSAPGSPYHFTFSMESALLRNAQVVLNVRLQQGQLQMGSGISAYNELLAPLRNANGVSFFASAGSGGILPIVDRKTWSLWLPVKIPSFIPNIDPEKVKNLPRKSDGDSDEIIITPVSNAETVELRFDDTLCTYQKADIDRYNRDGNSQASQVGDFLFVSCSKAAWLPGQFVRSKSISLGFKKIDNDSKDSLGVGVVLETAP